VPQHWAHLTLLANPARLRAAGKGAFVPQNETSPHQNFLFPHTFLDAKISVISPRSDACVNQLAPHSTRVTAQACAVPRCSALFRFTVRRQMYHVHLMTKILGRSVCVMMCFSALLRTSGRVFRRTHTQRCPGCRAMPGNASQLMNEQESYCWSAYRLVTSCTQTRDIVPTVDRTCVIVLWRVRRRCRGRFPPVPERIVRSTGHRDHHLQKLFSKTLSNAL